MSIDASNKNGGGIYVNTATHLNFKCVLFGISLALGYWYLPSKKNIFMLPVIFTIAYVAMAWYDELYDCSSILYSGSSSWGMAVLDSIFKPQQRGEKVIVPEGKYLVTHQEAIYKRYVYLFHLMIVVPLFVIIGYYRTSKLSQKLYLPLLGFSLLGMSYHTYRSINPRPEQSHIIYPLHILGFIPLALYIGWKGVDSNKLGFNGLLWLGVVAGMYHSIRYLSMI